MIWWRGNLKLQAHHAHAVIHLEFWFFPTHIERQEKSHDESSSEKYLKRFVSYSSRIRCLHKHTHTHSIANPFNFQKLVVTISSEHLNASRLASNVNEQMKINPPNRLSFYKSNDSSFTFIIATQDSIPIKSFRMLFSIRQWMNECECMYILLFCGNRKKFNINK